MTQAIRIHATGGPEVMRWEDVPMPEPGPGEALVRHEAVGLNYIDVYFRTGLYKAPLPCTPGMEAAGVVVAVGAGVTEVKPGDRVAYAGGPVGAYATERVIAADRLVVLPAGIDAKTGAAMMLQGMTAQYLLRRTYRVKSGDTIVVHAAAGYARVLLAPASVRFRMLGDDEIERYLRLEQPYDCAGSAKCETLGIALLEAIDSDDPTALVGLPLIRTARMLRDVGIDPLRHSPE